MMMTIEFTTDGYWRPVGDFTDGEVRKVDSALAEHLIGQGYAKKHTPTRKKA